MKAVNWIQAGAILLIGIGLIITQAADRRDQREVEVLKDAVAKNREIVLLLGANYVADREIEPLRGQIRDASATATLWEVAE